MRGVKGASARWTGKGKGREGMSESRDRNWLYRVTTLAKALSSIRWLR